jgi:hypothetical protein
MSEERVPHITLHETQMEQDLIGAQRMAMVDADTLAAVQKQQSVVEAMHAREADAVEVVPQALEPLLHTVSETTQEIQHPSPPHHMPEDTNTNTTSYILDIGMVPELDEEQAYRLWQEEASLEEPTQTHDIPLPTQQRSYLDRSKHVVALGLPVQLPLTYHTEQDPLPLEPVHKVNPVRKKARRK